MKYLRKGLVFSLALLGLHAAIAQSPLRVCTYNISNYAGGRDADLGLLFFKLSASGVRLKPDLLLVQEITSSGGRLALLNILNTASGSPGDYAASPWDIPVDTQSVLYYRTSKIDFISQTQLAAGSSVSPNQPRDVLRCLVRLHGYSADSTVFAIYNSHFKAGSAADDMTRRETECNIIRNDANTLNAAYARLIGGDFNIQSSNETAYQILVGSTGNNTGRFYDPTNRPGTWNNSSTYKFLHSQDPIGAGGMDDRYDQILMTSALFDGASLEYIGNQTIPFSSTTWNDPNHSYRTFGNDGTSYNLALNSTSNAMVDNDVALAIKNAANGAGHIPVFLDIKVPPKINASLPLMVDFGRVRQGTTQQRVISIGNGGDTALWSASGINSLHYSITLPAPFSTAPGPFISNAGGALNSHTITMNTATAGSFTTNLVLTTDDPDNPTKNVLVKGYVVGNRSAPPPGF